MSAAAIPGSPRRSQVITAAVAAGAFGLAVVGVLALAQGQVRVGTSAQAVLQIVAGLSFVGCGLIASRRRPDISTGRLMMVAGFLVFASALQQSDTPLAFTIALVTSALPLAVLAHLLLTFPDGRLHSRGERWLVVVIYVVTGLLQGLMLMFMSYDYVTFCPCPENLLFVSDDQHIHMGLMDAQRVMGVGMTVGVVAVLVYRWRFASPPLRRAMGPIAVAGGATIALLGAQLLSAEAFSREAIDTFSALQEIAFAAVPVAYLAGLFHARLARGAVSDLVVALRDMPEPGRLRAVLAQALRDPSLEVVYWLPKAQSYVDLAGRPVGLSAGDDRAVTEIERHGARVAALVHDRALRESPGLLDAVSAAAGLALENERLLADLRAQLDTVRESRARIVEAGDTERQRLERNLHDGAQQRLVSMSLGLGIAADKIDDDPATARKLIGGAREELTQALSELRDLAEGIHPAILTDRGLNHALERLAERAPVPVDLDVRLADRLPEPIEAAAYYVVAEALTNVAKYAQAQRARVTVSDGHGALRVEIADDGVGGADPRGGSGLRGLDDRVQAFGGRLDVDSQPGAGTRIIAELPT
jgi:signal transduction histidine kinase